MSVRPRIASSSCGYSEPSLSWSPGSILSPSPTYRRVRRGNVCAVLVAGVVGDDDGARLVGVLDGHDAADLGDLRQALRLARLEQLDDARQAVRDVRAGDAAGVERPHGQLRAGLADRLGGDDADRVADLRDVARRHRAAVARLAQAGGRLALEHRADGERLVLVLAERLDEHRHVVAVDLLARAHEHLGLLALADLDVLGRDAPDQHLVGLARASP